MVAGIPKPERRLTKVRRKLSTRRPISSGRSEKENRSRPASPQHLPNPILTTCDDLRSSSTTRLQLREHFSSTFPESDASPVYGSSQTLTAHRRPSTSSVAESHQSNAEEPQSIDVPAAIALLQELKKHASPDELVALHKALLPVRRSVDAVSIPSPQDFDTSTAPESRYSSHRRSTRYPGLATRGNDPLQTIEELEIKRRSYREEKRRLSAAIEAAHDGAIAASSLAVPRSGGLARTASTGSSDNANVGWYRAGTLRITNRDPSPSSVRLEPSSELPGRLNALDGVDELVLLDSACYKVRQAKTSFDLDSARPKTAGALHESSGGHDRSIDLAVRPKTSDDPNDLPATHKKAVPATESSMRSKSFDASKTPLPVRSSTDQMRGMEQAKPDSGVHLTTLRTDLTAPLRTTLSETDLTRPYKIVRAFSSSKVSLNAAMDEYSHFTSSPYDRPSTQPVSEDPKSPSASSCDSFKTSVEARPDLERRQRTLEHPPMPAAPSFDKFTKTLASDRPMPPRQGDSGYASEESNGRPSRSLETHRVEQDRAADLRPITPKSPHSSIRTIRSRTTEEAYLPSSIDALPPAAHSFQRIEDIFVAPGDSRPQRKRQTLLSSLGLGRRSSDSSRSAVHSDKNKSSASEPKRTMSAGGRKDKTPKKLQKAGSQKSKARKELAKFDPETSRTIRPVSPVQNEPEEEAYGEYYDQDQYHVPRYPAPHKYLVQQGHRDRWQPPQYDARRYRNLSVVQEVDHDSLMEHDGMLGYNSPRSSRRSELQYSECGDIQIGVSLLQPMYTTGPTRPLSGARPLSVARPLSSGARPLSGRPVSMERLDRTSTQSTHRVTHSVSSMSSIATGQLDLIEEVQNATIDWAVQAKFWRARRTLVGQAFQQDPDEHDRYSQHAGQSDDDEHDAPPQDPGQILHDEHELYKQCFEQEQYGEHDPHSAQAKFDEHNEQETLDAAAPRSQTDPVHKTVDRVDRELALIDAGDRQLTFLEALKDDMIAESFAKDFSTKYRHFEDIPISRNSIPVRPRNFSSPIPRDSLAGKSRNALVDNALEMSGQGLNERLPVAELLGRRHMAMPGRFSGGLQYEWDRESGLVSSAGFNDNVSANNGRSLPSRMRYGVDLSDVPVFVAKAGPDRSRSSMSVGNTH